VATLSAEFSKLWGSLKEKKANELKSICKTCNIKGLAGLKKDVIIVSILQYYSNNLKFRLDDNSVATASTLPDKNKKTDKGETTPMEELEKQRQEIELKMKEELTKQKKAEEDAKKAIEEEERKVAEEQKKKEKEEAKRKKQSIPKQVRVIVWNHYIGEDIIKHKCLCCKKVTITNTNFDVGHVLSEKNGGTHEINNLRPICGACNHSMGSENMVDFVVKYGLYIG
jgi:uncharacterized CHY-type Zn-finger protein